MKLTKSKLKQLIKEEIDFTIAGQDISDDEENNDELQSWSEIIIDKAVTALIEGTYDFDPPQEKLDELEEKFINLLEDDELISILDEITKT